jgi:hypothetical protein
VIVKGILIIEENAAIVIWILAMWKTSPSINI